MRRWVLAFLLFVVPFQLVWGSAAPYCAHEASVSAKKHFGHHEHKHQAGASATDDSGDGSGAYHADCESCHLGSFAAVPSISPVVEPLNPGSAESHREPRYDSHIPAGPQRPDRAAGTPAARLGGGVVVVSLAD